jgi:hypothetical protein
MQHQYAVYVGWCPVCGREAIGCGVHDGCRIAQLEDLLSRVQGHVEVLFGTPLPRELVAEIKAGDFRSFAQYEVERSAQQWLKYQHQADELLRHNTAAAEVELPGTYAGEQPRYIFAPDNAEAAALVAQIGRRAGALLVPDGAMK